MLAWLAFAPLSSPVPSHWELALATMEDAVFDAFAEPVTLNGRAVAAIIAREMVDIGDYAAEIHEHRWRIYAKKSDVAQFQRKDVVLSSGKQFRVELPDTDDGSEVTAWLREV